MTVTIIIATRNRRAALRDTLRALDQVPPPAGLATEVLVVDNGSTDDTRAGVAATTVWARPVRYLPEPRAGKSTALNAALAVARGEQIPASDLAAATDAANRSLGALGLVHAWEKE